MATKYMYSFKSEVGTFWIRQERDKSWSLSIGEDIIEEISYFSSAAEAADSVHMQTTGWDEWTFERVTMPQQHYRDGKENS
jgi:hypothetical protein